MSNNLEMKFEREPAEIVAEILGRWTVTDLTEQSNESLSRGDELLGKSKKPIKIAVAGTTNLIRWWKVESDGTGYEVRRFENFVWCSCLDFFFNKKCCRHITVTTRFYCKRCFKREVQFGKLCVPCQQDTSPYLKPNISRPAEKVGRIRIN